MICQRLRCDGRGNGSPPSPVFQVDSRQIRAHQTKFVFPDSHSMISACECIETPLNTPCAAQAGMHRRERSGISPLEIEGHSRRLVPLKHQHDNTEYSGPTCPLSLDLLLAHHNPRIWHYTLCIISPLLVSPRSTASDGFCDVLVDSGLVLSLAVSCDSFGVNRSRFRFERIYSCIAYIRPALLPSAPPNNSAPLPGFFASAQSPRLGRFISVSSKPTLYDEPARLGSIGQLDRRSQTGYIQHERSWRGQLESEWRQWE